MKIYFDNIFGYQTKGDLLFSVVSAEFEKNEWNHAFETGWAPVSIIKVKILYGINQDKLE